MENLRGCIDWLATLDPADRDDVRAVLQTIVRGQELDVRRFGDAGSITPLRSADELEEYTYLVAGCVGDFWTRLGVRHLPRFARRSPDEMSALGVEYGKGLQLVNVLRDTGADLQAGRSYLPAEELAVASFAEIFIRWLERAEKKIGHGIEYCASLTNWRVRFATALPALIGARTIALLRDAGEEAPARKIKVSRREVRRILAGAAVAMASPIALQALFQRLLAPPR